MIPQTYNDVLAIRKCSLVERYYEIQHDSILIDIYEILKKHPDNYLEGNRTQFSILNNENQIIKTYVVDTREKDLNTIKITNKKATVKRYI